MWETTNLDHSLSDANLSSSNILDTNPAQNTSGSIVYDAGTLEADTFSIIPGYEITVVSGNGNVDYGSGVYDTLDLSDFTVTQVLQAIKTERCLMSEMARGRLILLP